MKRLGVIALVLVSVQLLAQDVSVAPQKLTKIKFDWVEVKLPEDFVLMEDEAFFRTTASAVKPEVAYRDPGAQISFTVNNSVNRWGNNLDLLGQFQKSTIMSLHKKVDFKKEEIIEIKKRRYLLLAFDSKVDDKITPDGQKRIMKHYNYMLYTVKSGHLITVALRMPNWMKEEGWEVAADEIMRSVRVK